MKKELTIAFLTLLFTAAPVMAHSNHENNDDNNGNAVTTQTVHQTEIKDNDSDKDNHNTKPTSAIQTITPSCDPSADWKNHGEFVSCVAHLHHGDNDEDNDEAARSDIGKTNNPTPTISVTPTETITPEETVSPSPSVSPTPTASVSPTPEISDMDIYKAPKNNTDNNFVNVLGRVLFFLSHLL